MVLVGAVISLATIPLSMSTAPGAPSLVMALSSVGLVWPLLGEALIIIGAVRLVATNSRAVEARPMVGVALRIGIERRVGVGLVALGGALILSPIVGTLIGIVRAFGEISLHGSATPAAVFNISAVVLPAWIFCIIVGGGLLLASEVELRRQ